MVNQNLNLKKNYTIDEILKEKGVVGTKEGEFMENVLKKGATTVTPLVYDFFRDKYFHRKDVDFNSYVRQNSQNNKQTPKVIKQKKPKTYQIQNTKGVLERAKVPRNMIENEIPYISKFNGDKNIDSNKIYEYEVLMKIITNNYKKIEADVILANTDIHKEVGNLVFYKGKKVLWELKSFQK